MPTMTKRLVKHYGVKNRRCACCHDTAADHLHSFSEEAMMEDLE